jgi:predicted DNA-binding transcriptional regulator AlpA
MKQSQIDSLRDYAIENLPRAQADREQLNRFGGTSDDLYRRLAFTAVSVRAKAATTAIEFAAANVLESVSMLRLAQEPPLTARQRTDLLGRLARDTKELCSLTGKAIAWLDTVPATPEPEEPEDETPAPQAPVPSIAGRMLTTRETAKVLGMSEQTLRQHRSADRNLIPPVKVGKREWRYPGDAVLAFMNEKKK